MRNLELDTTMVIKRQAISFEMTKETGLNDDWVEWKLEQLTSIVTTTSIEESKSREDLIRKKRNQNVIVGAALGGVIDAANGDDGILDGVLFGSIAGAAISTSPRDPTAHIGLLFADGKYLALEVDEDEYAKLQTVLASNKIKNTAQDSQKDSITVRALTNDEKEFILSLRQDSNTNMNVIKAALMFLVGYLAYIGFFEKAFSFQPNEMQYLFKYFPFVAWVAGLYILSQAFFKSKNDLYKQDEQNRN